MPRPRRPRLLERLFEHPEHFRWPKRLATLLGKIPDDALARKARVHPQTVFNERRRRGIPASRPQRPPIDWTPPMIALLGTDSDARIAGTLGIHTSSVAHKRRRLGIPSCYEPPPFTRDQGYPWPPHALSLLGKHSDKVVGKQLRLHEAAVWYKRTMLGIPSFRPRKIVRWTKGMLKLLGDVPDRQIALRFEIQKQTVKCKREELEIPPFREPPRKIRRCEALRALLRKSHAEILEHADAPVTREGIRKLRLEYNVRHSPPPRPWLPKQLVMLGRAPDAVVAKKLGRTESAVKQKRHALGIWRRPRNLKDDASKG